MNFLIIILNRVHSFLMRVKNQSPLFGAVALVTILISFTMLNTMGFYYTFRIEPMIISIPIFLVINLLIFIPLFIYANRNKALITGKVISSSKTKSLIIVLLYLFTAISTICLANINRNKIARQTKKEQVSEPRKESLQGKIRKWFE